jgi:putative ABC transport system ATP-binding protein
MTRIVAENVGLKVGHRRILEHVDLKCEPGTMTGLIGPSGCGKTTLLHCLGLLLTPSTGRVLVDGVDTTRWGDGDRRRFWQKQGAFVLQDYGVIEEESVQFNVSMRSGIFRQAAKVDAGRVEAVLEETGLAGMQTQLAAHLSGGEKQRLAIARAIYKNAQTIFVDEPTASLDSQNRARVVELLALLAQRGRLVIVATHDDEMMAACQSRYVVGDRAALAADAGTPDKDMRQ